MKKLAVIIGGWHYSWHLYKSIIKQQVPEGWEIDFFVVFHRHPSRPEVREEKYEACQNDKNPFLLDKLLYKTKVTENNLIKSGWICLTKPNTVGDLEFFNQWAEDYDWKKYDMFFFSHDDNFILSSTLFIDVLTKNIPLYKIGDIESGYVFEDNERKGLHIHNEMLLEKNDFSWIYLDNGQSQQSRFRPRNSFLFFTSEFIIPIKGHFELSDLPQRLGKFSSPTGHKKLSPWNATGVKLGAYIVDNNMLHKTRFLSDCNRISNYCIEGERGFVNNINSATSRYLEQVIKIGKTYEHLFHS